SCGRSTSPSCWSAPRSPPLQFNTSRFVFWSEAGFAPPPSAPEKYASKGRLRRLGLYGEMGYTADRVSGISQAIPACRNEISGDRNGRGRKLEPHHEHADGRAQGNTDPVGLRRYADGHA